MVEYLALPDGAGGFSQDFSGPVILRMLAGVSCFTPTGLSPSSMQLSSLLRLQRVTPQCESYNPDAAETAAV